MSKYIIDTDCFLFETRGIMGIGLSSDMNISFKSLPIDDLEELTADYINKHFGVLQDTAYQKGFEDGKTVHEKGCDGCKYEGTEIYLRPCSACRNVYPNQYTAKQSDDKIEVGDVVNIKNTGDGLGIVTKKYENQCCILWADGSSGLWNKEDVEETGRHFDIDKILDEMKGTGADDDTH